MQKDKCYGQRLITVATAISFQLAGELTADQLGVLGELFAVLGDELALLALTVPTCDGQQPTIEI